MRTLYSIFLVLLLFPEAGHTQSDLSHFMGPRSGNIYTYAVSDGTVIVRECISSTNDGELLIRETNVLPKDLVPENFPTPVVGEFKLHIDNNMLVHEENGKKGVLIKQPYNKNTKWTYNACRYDPTCSTLTVHSEIYEYGSELYKDQAREIITVQDTIHDEKQGTTVIFRSRYAYDIGLIKSECFSAPLNCTDESSLKEGFTIVLTSIKKMKE